MPDETDSTAADALVAARKRVETLRSRLDGTGLDRSELETVADAYREVETVLEIGRASCRERVFRAV